MEKEKSRRWGECMERVDLRGMAEKALRAWSGKLDAEMDEEISDALTPNPNYKKPRYIPIVPMVAGAEKEIMKTQLIETQKKLIEAAERTLLEG